MKIALYSVSVSNCHLASAVVAIVKSPPVVVLPLAPVLLRTCSCHRSTAAASLGSIGTILGSGCVRHSDAMYGSPELVTTTASEPPSGKGSWTSCEAEKHHLTKPQEALTECKLDELPLPVEKLNVVAMPSDLRLADSSCRARRVSICQS